VTRVSRGGRDPQTTTPPSPAPGNATPSAGPTTPPTASGRQDLRVL
jgi:hypothetical protein